MENSNSENYSSATGSYTASERYLSDLADIQMYLYRLQQLVSECEEGAENSDDFFLRQFADEYLEALRIKQRQLAGVRTYMMRTSTDSTSSVINEMLDEVEPLCLNMIEMLSKLRGEKSKSKPELTDSSGEAAADAHLPRNDELVAQLEVVSIGRHPTPTVRDTNAEVPTDIEETDEDVPQDDTGDSPISGARGTHISTARDNALAGNVSITASFVLQDQVLTQQTPGQQLSAFFVILKQ